MEPFPYLGLVWPFFGGFVSLFRPDVNKKRLTEILPPRKKVLPRASLDTAVAAYRISIVIWSLDHVFLIISVLFENGKELHKEGWVQNQGWKRILDPGSPIWLNFLSPNAKNRSQMLFSFLHYNHERKSLQEMEDINLSGFCDYKVTCSKWI